MASSRRYRRGVMGGSCRSFPRSFCHALHHTMKVYQLDGLNRPDQRGWHSATRHGRLWGRLFIRGLKVQEPSSGWLVHSLGRPAPLRYVGVRLADSAPVDGPPSSAHSGRNYGGRTIGPALRAGRAITRDWRKPGCGCAATTGACRVICAGLMRELGLVFATCVSFQQNSTAIAGSQSRPRLTSMAV